MTRVKTSRNAESLVAVYIYIYIYISILLQTSGIRLLDHTHNVFYKTAPIYARK